MKNVKISTYDPYVKWYSSDVNMNPAIRIYSRGYAFIDDLYVEGEILVHSLQKMCLGLEIVNIHSMKKICGDLNGSWAFICSFSGKKYFAATDRFRNIPVFYAHTNDQFIIAASVNEILQMIESYEIDSDLAIEFLLTRNVNCGDTLYKGIKQILPGEIISVEVDNDDIIVDKTRYYRFLPTQFFQDSEIELEEKCQQKIDSVFRRLVQSCEGETIYLPLSGGLDSRLLAAMLKKYDHKEVVCYSYGNKGNPESTLSREVAKYLGYEWKFIETSPSIWAEITKSDEMVDYWDYCFQGACLPHIGDYPAISLFAKEEEWGENVRVWPGLAMDFNAGSLLEKTQGLKLVSKDFNTVETYILRRRYNLWPMNYQDKKWVERFFYKFPFLLERLRSSIETPESNCTFDPLLIYELFELEHRITYVLNNSMRLYEYYGNRWHLPFWDYELVDFFISVPLKYRFKKRLYVNTLREKIFTGSLSGLKQIPVFDKQYKYKNWKEDL